MGQGSGIHVFACENEVVDSRALPFGSPGNDGKEKARQRRARSFRPEGAV
jgi:hypothetical protein